MTHEELFSKIGSSDTLGIVVEIIKLHTPFKWHYDDTIVCDGCSQLYPCPTIMTIAKNI